MRDGWSIYRQFIHALHQTCLAHLLRRCREMILVARSGKRNSHAPSKPSCRIFAAARSSSATTDQRTRISGGPGKVGSADRSDLGTALSLTAESPFGQPSVTGAGGSIYVPELSRSGSDELAAEQAIRPMVVTRKVWGGNRTSRGAHTQSILVSILQTCRQQLRSASSILQKLICASQPKPLDLTVPMR